jgi:hypothetical protein
MTGRKISVGSTLISGQAPCMFCENLVDFQNEGVPIQGSFICDKCWKRMDRLRLKRRKQR